MYPPGLKSIWWVVCPAICGNHSTNQRWENGKNLVERDQKLIIPAESHDECNHQVWGQSQEHSVQKCTETALTIQAFSAPSHYLNQWWLLVNRTLRNKPYWNMDQNTVIFLHGHALENMCNTWCRPYCLHLNMLIGLMSHPGLSTSGNSLNTLRPRQNGRHFADDTFKHIFLYENVWISIEVPLKFVPEAPINNIPALVKIMAWCRPGDKSLSEPKMVRLPTHICVSRPQWVK